MKKGLRIACKILSVFLSILLVVQIAPLEIMANAYNEATVNENTENALDVSTDEVDTTESKAEIIAEETSKREENVKHFRMSDGSYRAAQYDVPVHFMQNGEWTDYDNTLTEVDADDEENENKLVKNKDLKNTLADYTVRLSKKTNGKKFVRIEKDGYKLSWYYTNARKATAQIAEVATDDDDTTLEKLSSRVTYEDVYKNTDFEYIVGSNGLKENIILKKSNVKTTFEAEYKVNGLTPIQVDSHTINLVSEDNEIVYTISAPYMIDYNGEISTDVAITLSNVKNNKFTVTTTLDEAWLDDENRAYPVIVDPVLKTKQLYSEMDSTFVGTKYKDRCYYTYGNSNGGADSGSLYVGNISGYGQTESYLKINTLPTLTVADTVVSAQLGMGLITCELGMQLDVKRLTSQWEMNTVTWNTKPTAEPIISDYKMLNDGDSSKFIYFEITDIVRGWYSGEYPNYGISFSTQKTSAAKAWMFSSDFSAGGLTQNRPILYVNYRNMSGYEDYWSYTGLSAGRNGAVSVNNYNGNLVFTQPLTQGDGGNLMPVALSLVYNSNGKNAEYTYMAKNMQTNYHVFVRYDSTTAENGYKYYLNDADGTKHWFYFDDINSTTGKDEDGLGYTLDVITEGSDSLCTYTDGDNYAKYRITDKDKNKMYFDCSGVLIQITNANGISSTVQYETVEDTMRMKSVTDGAGRVYTFQYHELYPYLCVSITDPAGRKTSFVYGDGLMKSLVFPDGKTYSLYYTNRELTNIGSIDGTRTAVVYDNTAQKRVSNINWGTSDTSLLESYSFAYKQNETKVTDIQNRSYTYQFNDFGQNTGVVSNSEGAAQYFEYNDVGDNKADSRANKLVSQSKVINTVTNYVINPGFTYAYNNGYWTYAPDSTGSPTATVDSTKGNITKNSMKVYKPSTNTGNVMIVQNLSSIAAGTYTLSGYVDTNNQKITGGVYLGVEFRNSSGNLVYTQRAEPIDETNGWQRVSLTFTLPENHTLTFVAGFAGGSNNAYGTVWFDDFQIEKGVGMSSYTMVEDGGFNNGQNCWSNATLSSASGLPGINKALYMTGNPQTQWQGIGQNLYPQNGKAGDVYSFGAWVKADSVPVNSPAKQGETCQPDFSLVMYFYDANGTWIQTEKAEANDDINTWQFISAKAVAKYDYARVFITTAYNYNANTSAVTGTFCFREEFGQTYDYDDNGNVQSVVDLSNSKSSFAFKGNQMSKMLNPSGSEYFYTYDYNESNLTEAFSTDGQRYWFTYDDKGNVLSSTIEQDKFALTLETGKGYVIRNAESGNVINNSPTITNWRYRRANANQVWYLESTGETDVYYLRCTTYGGVYMKVGDNDDIIATTSPSGNAFKFKLQTNGDGTFTILTKSSNYEKCIDGQPDSSKNYEDESPLKQWARISNDESQHWYFYPDITAASGAQQQDYISTSATYTDSKNFVASQTDQRGYTTTYNYDENKGTLTSVTDAKGKLTTYQYDANTNALQSVTSGGMTNSYEYDENSDRLTGINVNNGTRYKFFYDSFGRTTATQVGNGTNYRNLSTLQYNSAGLLSKQTYGNDDFIEFEYDNLDRLVNKSYNGSSTDKVQYHYGTDGRLSQIIDFSTNSRMKYVYDLAGRVVSTREYDGANLTGINLKSSVNYTYADKTNYLTGVTHFSPLGTQNIGYRYGNMSLGEMPDQIYGVTWNGNEKVSYTYDGLGRLTNKAVGGNVPFPLNTTYSYFDVDDTKTTTLLSSMSNDYLTYNYTYDELGNITNININQGDHSSYEYDDLNQLVRENNHDQNKTFTYEYVNGNIKYRHEYAYTTGELPSTPTITTEYHYEDSTWSDVLTGVSQYRYTASNTSTYGLRNNSSSSFEEYVRSILGDDLGDYEIVDLGSRALLNLEPENSNASTYSLPGNTSLRFSYSVESDAIGNITYIDGIEIEWDGRRAVAVQKGDNTITYEYNIDGQRTKKTVNGVTTEYFYNGDILAGQKTGNDTIIFMYDNNGDIFGFEYNGTPYYYVKNAQNDVVMVLNCNDRTAVVYQYDAWGNITDVYDSTTQRVSNINPITYRSYYYDIEMGVYYLNSRYYVPIICRFISGDSVTDGGAGIIGANLFVYAANNPVTNADPSGHFVVSAVISKVVLGAAIGGVIGAVSGAVSNTVSQLIGNGWDFKNLNYKEIGRSALVGGVTGALAGAFGTAIGLTGASVVAKSVATIVTNGVISAGGYTLDTMLNGEKPTYSDQATAFVGGAITTVVSMGLSSGFNHSSFKNYTKSQKHSALGGNVSHRNIRNGSYIKTQEYKEFLVSNADNIQDVIEFTFSIFENGVD